MKSEKRQLPQSKREGKIAVLKKITAVLLTVSTVLFFAVFFAFVPFRLMLPAYGIPAREEGELRFHFLRLEGGVTVVEFPDGEVLVVNAGDGSFDNDNTLCRYLRGLGISSLSVLATSADSSHIGGMPALFDTFGIDKVYLPASGADTGFWKRFVSAMDKEGCERVNLARYGTIVNGSGAYAVCLSPYSVEEEDATAEDKSTVLYFSYSGVNVLLPGDLTAKRERKLVSEYSLSDGIFDSGNYRVRLGETHILLASSHGSDNGSSEAWLSLLCPSATVVCCNENERPSDNALKRIAAYSGEVYRTDELGAVTVSVKDGGFKTQTHISG